MIVSLLNVRLTLQMSEDSFDETKNHSNIWTDYYSCYATVTEETGNEKTTEVGIVENDYMNFTIRYCKALENISTTEYRVMFQGDIYDIIGINHMNFKKKCLKLRCKRARR